MDAHIGAALDEAVRPESQTDSCIPTDSGAVAMWQRLCSFMELQETISKLAGVVRDGDAAAAPCTNVVRGVHGRVAFPGRGDARGGFFARRSAHFGTLDAPTEPPGSTADIDDSMVGRVPPW